MFCPNCGNQNPDNINYCTSCGASLNNASQYQNFSNNNYQQQNANYQTASINAESVYATEAYKFRGFARQVLQGKWGTAALLMLVFTLCTFGINFVAGFIPAVGNLATLVISPVLSFGLLALWIKFRNGENINYLDFFSIGFNNFSSIWGVILRVTLKLLGPIILMLVATIMLTTATALPLLGDDIAVISLIVAIVSFVAIIGATIWLIPLSYKYMFALNELVYSPGQSAKDIVERSGNFMMGKRVGAFWLSLTFIGWSLLAALGCGIPFLWVTPYMTIATVIYYEWASGRLDK